MFRPQLLASLRHYDRRTFAADLVAGLTVGVLALPLAMAFAIASGLPPERGLFTAVIAGLLISALGGSRVQIGGPTGAFVVIVSEIVLQYGYGGLVLCTFLAGLMLIAFGLCRMGAMIRFIPFPVTTGFTTGIAVVIFTTQVGELLGLQYEEAPHGFVATWLSIWKHLHTVNPGATLIGLGTVLGIVVLRRLLPRAPGMLIAMMAATGIAWLLGLEVATIGTQFGELPRTLPMPAVPDLDFGALSGLIAPAFTVAMLAAIESLLSATVADGMTGRRHDPDTELIAQGVANIGSVLFGGIPATGAIARTATNVKSGAKTPVSGIIHAATLALILLLFAPMARQVPLAALAGILVVVSYNMSEIHHFIRLLRAPRSDVLVLLTTFVLTVLVDLTVAVEVGVVLAAMLFIRRMAEVANVEAITRDVRGEQEHGPDPNATGLRTIPAGVEVFEVQGPFFFGAADRFKQAMMEIQDRARVIVLRLRHVPAIDATGLHVLTELHRRCAREGTTLILSGVHDQPMAALERSGLLKEIGGANVHTNIDDALAHAADVLGLQCHESWNSEAAAAMQE